jgi:hypothetical protein
MFVCRTDNEIVVGCIFLYEGEEQRYYEAQAVLPLDEVEHLTEKRYCFYSVTSPYYIYSYFYTTESEVPEERYYLCEIELDGLTVWFVIADVEISDDAIVDF